MGWVCFRDIKINSSICQRPHCDFIVVRAGLAFNLGEALLGLTFLGGELIYDNRSEIQSFMSDLSNAASVENLSVSGATIFPQVK